MSTVADHLPVANPLPAVLLLKRGTESPPIFIAHGLGDTVFGLSNLAKHLRCSNAVYGLQARGMDGLADPFDRVEEMAQYHLESIRRLQPQGPYILIGYSLGGLVALEMAQRLAKEGEQIALLVMLDSYVNTRFLPLPLRLLLLWQRASRKIVSPVRRNIPRNEDGRTATILDKDDRSLVSTGEGMQRVRQAQYRALRTYRPSFYDGTVKFVRAAIPTSFAEDPNPMWTPLVRTFEVETVPGSHVELLEIEVDALAAVVTRYVNEALEKK
jgi:thioesterase domain-containing protein